MDSKELRIGSLIYWDIPEKENVIHTVVGIRNDKPQTIPISLGESIGDYNPIPLSEELFDRITEHGFDFCGFGTRVIYQSIKFPAIKYEFTYNKVALYFNEEMISILDFIHSWQNIHFDLTGEELTMIKL